MLHGRFGSRADVVVRSTPKAVGRGMSGLGQSRRSDRPPTTSGSPKRTLSGSVGMSQRCQKETWNVADVIAKSKSRPKTAAQFKPDDRGSPSCLVITQHN